MRDRIGGAAAGADRALGGEEAEREEKDFLAADGESRM
jgi:hypothetical protein